MFVITTSDELMIRKEKVCINILEKMFLFDIKCQF